MKNLREERELPLNELSAKTLVSTSTLSRLENAQGSANTLTISALVDFYGLRDRPLGDRLLRWAKEGRKQAWWQHYPSAAIENTKLYVEYESQAAIAKLFVIPFMPVLLQTREYTRALAETFHPDYTPDEVRQLVEFRERRQQVLKTRPGRKPLQLRVVIHETCLLQVVSSSEVMQAQLQKLLDVLDDETLDVDWRILPFTSRPHTATRSVWSHFTYADRADEDITLIETHLGLMTPLENAADVKKSARQFDELWELSRNRDISTDLVRAVMKEYS